MMNISIMDPLLFNDATHIENKSCINDTLSTSFSFPVSSSSSSGERRTMLNCLFLLWKMYKTLKMIKEEDWFYGWLILECVGIHDGYHKQRGSKTLSALSLSKPLSTKDQPIHTCQNRQCTSIYNTIESVNATRIRIDSHCAYAIAPIVTEYQVASKNTKANLPLISTTTTRSSGLFVFQTT